MSLRHLVGQAILAGLAVVATVGCGTDKPTVIEPNAEFYEMLEATEAAEKSGETALDQ